MLGPSLLLLAACGGDPYPIGVQTLTAASLRADVVTLSGDDFQGRGTGETGADLAATFLDEAFAEIGLQPLPGHDGFQVPYTVYQPSRDPETTFLRGDGIDGTLGVDLLPFGFSEVGEVHSEVVFAGYGITAPELGWDDYADLDVNGKTVLVLRHDPGEGDEESVWKEHAEHARFTAKATAAKARGAVAMILVTDPLNHEDSDDLRPNDRMRLEAPEPLPTDVAEDAVAFLSVRVSRAIAEQLVAPLGKDLAALQTALNAGATVNGPIPDRTVDLSVGERVLAATLEPVNLIGYLPGRDPEHAEEWVVIGGHYDHLGAFSGEGDTVYNGADDNASGTAGVLALARAFASLPERPERSVVFVGFSGEEEGLLGSRAAVRDEVLDPDRTVFMINLDMIGRPDTDGYELIGDGYSSGTREAIEAVNAELGVPITFAGEDYSGNSDHHPFFQADVPVLFFFAGLHDDYHQRSDHHEKLEYDPMTGMVKLAFGLAQRLAEPTTHQLTPRFIHRINWLGARVDLQQVGEHERAVLTAIEEGGRAAAAGLRVDDRIYGFDDVRLEAATDVGEAFRAIDPGTRVRLTVERNDSERITLDIERA